MPQARHRRRPGGGGRPPVLLRDGHADRDYLARLTRTGTQEDRGPLRGETTPAWASEAITGLLGPAEIEDFASTLRLDPAKSYIRVGYGFSRSRNGSTGVHAVSCLPTITGAWQVEGGGALWGNGAIYHLDKTLIEGLDRPGPKSVRLPRPVALWTGALTGDKQRPGGGAAGHRAALSRTPTRR